MILKSQKFVKKYALLYTLAISIILLTPLIVYISLLINIDEAKLNLDLQNRAKEIIKLMDEYESDTKNSFYFPRFDDMKAGLYSSSFKPIFTLIEKTQDIDDFSYGFHKNKDLYYFIYPLPSDHYFKASYLIVSKRYIPTKIYLLALIIFVSIIIVLFFFSRYVLKSFSKPFEDVNKELDKFIRDSMHEINTPLSIININVDLFARKYGHSKYLHRIKSAAKTLSTIYDDMDYLIKYEKMEFKKESIDFSTFLKKRVDYFKEIASLKSVEFDLIIQKDIKLFFNPTKLQRVVDNTISNAIKYSYDNKKIVVKLSKQDDKIIFSVQDFGIGIKDTKKILQRYYRESDQKGGFGIGLDIVKQIVDDEGIKMQINSKLKEGTTFIYTFYR